MAYEPRKIRRECLMAWIFFDDSKHLQHGFALGAMVACENDPSEAVNDILRRHGLRPGIDEFKSRLPMNGPSPMQKVRNELLHYTRWNASIGLAIVPSEALLGAGCIKLLEKAMRHPTLRGTIHKAFFDHGIIGRRFAEGLAAELGLSSCSDFAVQSHTVPGIQLADLIASMCSTMLKSKLGITNKVLTFDSSAGYDPPIQASIDFEFFADLRYAFLANPPEVTDDQDTDLMADVEPFGLFLDPTLRAEIATAALSRFGRMYYGCLH